MRNIARALLVAATLVPSFAFAQTPPEQSFTFVDGLQVAGTHQEPLMEVLTVTREGARPTLIRVRTQFIDEMLKSAENL